MCVWGGGAAHAEIEGESLILPPISCVASARFLASLNFSFLNCNVWMILLHKIVVRLQRILSIVWGM